MLIHTFIYKEELEMKEKRKVLQNKKIELEKLKRKQLYIDIGIFVLHGELQRLETFSDLKVYINLEKMQFTYIPIKEIVNLKQKI